MEKADGQQCATAEVVNPRPVVDDRTVVTETTGLEVGETTPPDQMVKDVILDELIEGIASDMLLDDATGLTNSAGLEPAKAGEKKRKGDDTEFTLPRFKVKSRKLTRYVQMKNSRISAYL